MKNRVKVNTEVYTTVAMATKNDLTQDFDFKR